MANSTQKTPRELSVERGKDIVIAIIVLFVSLEGLGLILKVMDQQPFSIVDLIRISITIVSCVYLYKGREWAKLLLALSASVETFIYLYTLYRVITSPLASFSTLAIILLLTGLSAMAAYYLLFSSNVDEFLKSQK